MPPQSSSQSLLTVVPDIRSLFEWPAHVCHQSVPSLLLEMDESALLDKDVSFIGDEYHSTDSSRLTLADGINEHLAACRWRRQSECALHQEACLTCEHLLVFYVRITGMENRGTHY